MPAKASQVNMSMQAPLLAPLCALVLGAIGLGGGVYETLVVDPVWPDKPAIIRRGDGGISRARFWAPAHALYELALLISLWMVWSVTVARGGPLPPWQFIWRRALGPSRISFPTRFGLKNSANSRKTNGAKPCAGRG